MAITVHELQQLVEDAFCNTGPFSHIFPGYNYRSDQVAMAQVVAKGIASGKAAFAEAGTGTGKSFATLIPAAIYAGMENKRVLVVTHNIALQQQLYDGDVPIVQKVLDMLNIEFRPALLKGKGNFVCTKALSETVKKHNPEDREELQKFLKDARDDKGAIVIGDKDKLSFQPSEQLWSKISVTQNTDCSDCPFKENACFVEHNKKRSKEANLIISNQFMLMNDLVQRQKNNFAPNSGTLPDYDVLIVDEAHHLEHVASDFLGKTIEMQPVKKLIGRMRRTFASNGPLKDYHTQRRIHMMQLIGEMEEMYTNLLADTRQFLDKKKSYSDYVEKPFTQDISIIQKVQFDVLRNKGYINDHKIARTLEGFARNLEEFYETAFLIQEGIKVDNREFVFWAEKKGDSAAVKATPIAVNKYLREGLFDRMPVILSSATMKFDSDIDFFARKVGALEKGEYESIFIPAPFKYEEQVCFYVPKHALDAPKSGDAVALKAYDDYCLNEMYELVKMSKGRAFLLFTSNTAVQQYYNILAPKFEAMGLKCFRQGGDIDRNQMISEFTEHGNAVLFGADTFWEGISVKGRELSLVVIHKIPFAVPNPVSKAREVNIKENGGDTFLEGQVFPAITKYKQGFGRLIRHEDDKGVFCMLDGRIFSKKDRYGIYFLRGTPKTQYAIDREKLKPFFE